MDPRYECKKQIKTYAPINMYLAYKIPPAANRPEQSMGSDCMRAALEELIYTLSSS
jgi:hypothetical protein